MGGPWWPPKTITAIKINDAQFAICQEILKSMLLDMIPDGYDVSVVPFTSNIFFN